MSLAVAPQLGSIHKRISLTLLAGLELSKHECIKQPPHKHLPAASAEQSARSICLSQAMQTAAISQEWYHTSGCTSYRGTCKCRHASLGEDSEVVQSLKVLHCRCSAGNFGPACAEPLLQHMDLPDAGT